MELLSSNGGNSVGPRPRCSPKFSRRFSIIFITKVDEVNVDLQLCGIP